MENRYEPLIEVLCGGKAVGEYEPPYWVGRLLEKGINPLIGVQWGMGWEGCWRKV
jgi:hypothetical protein